MKINSFLLVLSTAMALTACKPGANTAQTASQAAEDSITASGILSHIKVLASDEYEGRGPGTKGEELSVAYITAQMKRLGLKPGNPDGTYTQAVPLLGVKSVPTAWFTVGSKRLNLKFPDDYVVRSFRPQAEVKVTHSDLVFVGYGVVAPEYGWDDYKGVDVKGKTLVMLVNDPPVRSSADTSKLDSTLFKGKAMTYYGRWTYKYEIAAQKGAAAVILVHETGPAGYPFGVVQNSNGRENFDINTPDIAQRHAAVESWISHEKAAELFSAAGLDYTKLKQAAVSKDFKPVALKAQVNFEVKNTYRVINSQNVIGRLEGSDPKLKDEYIVYTAHWDHLGRDTSAKGDQIFNGALDNASGVATILEIAKAYSKLAVAPKRTILFLSVTAEEKGLLGSEYYAAHPLYPLNKTLANINIDGIAAYGRTKDIISVGFGNTSLDDTLQLVAAAQHRTVKPDAEPEKGYFYRSDHFRFAKRGVPALDPDAGEEFIGKPADYGRKTKDNYTEHDYHKPSDEVKADWDLSGAVEDTRLFFEVGYRVAQGESYPVWKPGTEFKAIREASMAGK